MLIVESPLLSLTLKECVLETGNPIVYLRQRTMHAVAVYPWPGYWSDSVWSSRDCDSPNPPWLYRSQPVNKSGIIHRQQPIRTRHTAGPVGLSQTRKTWTHSCMILGLGFLGRDGEGWQGDTQNRPTSLCWLGRGARDCPAPCPDTWGSGRVRRQTQGGTSWAGGAISQAADLLRLGYIPHTVRWGRDQWSMRIAGSWAGYLSGRYQVEHSLPFSLSL